MRNLSCEISSMWGGETWPNGQERWTACSECSSEFLYQNSEILVQIRATSMILPSELENGCLTTLGLWLSFRRKRHNVASYSKGGSSGLFQGLSNQALHCLT